MPCYTPQACGSTEPEGCEVVLPKPCTPPCSPSSHSPPSDATDLTLLEREEEQVCDLKQLHDDPQVSIQEGSTAIPFRPMKFT
jgi:hypothetical protein